MNASSTGTMKTIFDREQSRKQSDFNERKTPKRCRPKSSKTIDLLKKLT